MSPQNAFLEVNHDVDDSLLLASSGRSGSTWLAEVLSATGSCRYIFEAFDPKTGRNFRRCHIGTYIDPLDEPTQIDHLLDEIFAGRVRSNWTDKFNDSRRPDRRLVKEIRVTNLLPRIVRRYPSLPVIYLLRHPVPVAWSWTRLAWSDLGNFTRQRDLMESYFASQEPQIVAHDFIGHIYRWCLENVVPVRSLEPGDALVVFYENLVARPDEELERIRRFLARKSLGKWRGWVPAAVDMNRPSKLSLSDDKSPEGIKDRLEWWTRIVPEGLVGQAKEIVAEFGLDDLYGDEVVPLVDADAALDGTGRARDR